MRILTGLVLIAAALWSGWWFVGSRAEGQAARAFFASQRAQGKTATYSSLGVAGFPNRFDLTVNDIVLGDPAAGVTWRAPFAQLLGLSYNPYHFIAALPHRQQLETPSGTFTLKTRRFEASLRFVPGLAFALREFVAIADGPELDSSRGWSVTARSLRLASRQLPGRQTAQEVGLQADALTPDAGLKSIVDPQGTLPATMQQAYLDAELGFDAPIDRHIANRPPRLTDLRVKDAHVAWGPMLLSAQGNLTVNAQGQPEGRITLRAKDWRAMVDMAVATGLIRQQIAPTVRDMLAELSKTSGAPDTVDLPLAFHDGWMSIGPIPLGPAPKLR